MLRINDLVKTYASRGRRGGLRRSAIPAGTPAVNDISFEVAEGELFTLLGPSGCGKTTTLRSIAGFETPDSGVIQLDRQVLFSNRPSEPRLDVPPHRRAMGMVFQSYAIWPHMTVFDNVAFPFKVMTRGARPSKKQLEERVARVLEAMQLSDYAGRSATKLSGGQQQRLALARALVTEPRLLLLDEPLSNLDAKLRENLRFELKRMQEELGVTSIYVTHDQAEALAMSSRIAVMNTGNVVQVGTPREIYHEPATSFVGEFIGNSNFLSGEVSESKAGECRVVTPVGEIVVTTKKAIAPGTEVIGSIRPECLEVALVSTDKGRQNLLHGKILASVFLGETVEYMVEAEGLKFRSKLGPGVSLASDTPVTVFLDPEKITLMPVE